MRLTWQPQLLHRAQVAGEFGRVAVMLGGDQGIGKDSLLAPDN